jgi:hypothetical protein
MNRASGFRFVFSPATYYRWINGPSKLDGRKLEPDKHPFCIRDSSNGLSETPKRIVPPLRSCELGSMRGNPGFDVFNVRLLSKRCLVG